MQLVLTPWHYDPCKTLGSLTITAHSTLTLTFSLHPLTPKVIPHFVEPPYLVTYGVKILKVSLNLLTPNVN